jgi:hypothetical protein
MSAGLATAMVVLSLPATACGGHVAHKTPGHDAHTTAQKAVPAAPRPWFAPDSIWNAPVPATAKVDSNSKAMIAGLLRTLSCRMSGANRLCRASVASSSYSSPVYTVAARQPGVYVKLDGAEQSPLLQEALSRVPIPKTAVPAAGDDGQLVVWQPSSDTAWELWQARKLSDGWHASFGGKLHKVSTGPGHYRNLVDSGGDLIERSTWGSAASKLSQLGGLITIDELRRGRIGHALSFAVRGARKGVWSLPAQQTDGSSDDPSAIPEGAHLRLDPHLDLDSLDMPPITRMLAEAAQSYGLVLYNQTQDVSFYAEDPNPLMRATGIANPYLGKNGLYDGLSPWQFLPKFPWEKLQVLKLDLRRVGY